MPRVSGRHALPARENRQARAWARQRDREAVRFQQRLDAIDRLAGRAPQQDDPAAFAVGAGLFVCLLIAIVVGIAGHAYNEHLDALYWEQRRANSDQYWAEVNAYKDCLARSAAVADNYRALTGHTGGVDTNIDCER